MKAKQKEKRRVDQGCPKSLPLICFPVFPRSNILSVQPKIWSALKQSTKTKTQESEDNVQHGKFFRRYAGSTSQSEENDF